MSAHIIEIEKQYKKGGKRKCWVDGVEYDSMISMYRTLGITESLVYRFRYHSLNPDSSYEKAIAMALDYNAEYKLRQRARRERYQLEREERQKKAKLAEFKFDGKIYSCFPECVRKMSHEFGISLNANSIKARAKKNGYSLNEQLTLTIHKRYKRKKLLEQKYGCSVVC